MEITKAAPIQVLSALLQALVSLFQTSLDFPDRLTGAWKLAAGSSYKRGEK